LKLGGNYIDNTGFEPLLENLEELNNDCKIKVDLSLNNIVNID
jgi:hypothetical protein